MSWDWEAYNAAEEAAAEAACFGTALKNGFTEKQAEDCEDGSVGCPDCPFRPKAEEGP